MDHSLYLLARGPIYGIFMIQSCIIVHDGLTKEWRGLRGLCHIRVHATLPTKDYIHNSVSLHILIATLLRFYDRTGNVCDNPNVHSSFITMGTEGDPCA